MIKSILTAINFLTVFKAGTHEPADMAEVGRCSWAFPFAGLLMGFVLAGFWWILGDHLGPGVKTILVVGFWVAMTGGLHLDGWTDCWDAMGAAVPQERRLIILKDSRLGAFGAMALILLLALKAVTITELASPAVGLLLAPVVGRGIMAAVAFRAPHSGQGMAAGFIEGLGPEAVWKSMAVTACCVAYAGVGGFVAAAAAGLAAIWFRRLAVSRLGILNGDVIGGSCELAEAVFLIGLSVRW